MTTSTLVKQLSVAAVGAACMALGTGNIAQAATFLGNSVQVDYLGPALNEAAGTQIIDSDGAIFTAPITGVNALVTSTNILITNLSPGTFSSSSFNGFRFLDVNGTINSILGVTLGSSTFPGFDISRVTFDTDQIFVNFQGLPSNGGETISLDVQFEDSTPIPTPALLPGLLGMGVAALRKKRKEEAVDQTVEPAEV